MTFTSWARIAVRHLDVEKFGRSSNAYGHRDGRTMLVMFRPQSRGGRWFDRIGYWCVLRDGRLTRRRAAYGRRCRGAPWRWANAVRREHLVGLDGDPTVPSGSPPTFDQAFRERAVSFDELPAVLAGHDFHGGVAHPPNAQVGDPVVPMALPTVLPLRALSPRWRNVVLSKEELHLFLGTWRMGAAGGSASGDPACEAALEELCLAMVVLRRYESVCGRDLGRRFARGYDRACLRYRRARVKLRECQATATSGIRWSDLLAATASRTTTFAANRPTSFNAGASNKAGWDTQFTQIPNRSNPAHSHAHASAKVRLGFNL